MRSSQISRKYFMRLLISFLCISILPLGTCVIAILYANYAMSIEKYKNRVEVISNDYILKLENAMDEYKNIVQSVSENEMVRMMLNEHGDDNYRAEVESFLQSLMTGREDKMKLFILDANSSLVCPGTRNIPGVYRTDLFLEWGILHELSSRKVSQQTLANRYIDDENRQVSMSIGRAITDRSGQVTGFVILDIYRETLTGLMSVSGEEEAQVVLQDQKGITILDRTLMFEEGKRTKIHNLTQDISFRSILSRSEESKEFGVARIENDSRISLYTYLNISDFYEGMEMLLRISLILLLISIIVCLVAASLLTKRLYAPVGTLVKSMKKISDGDLDLRISVDEKKKDEMLVVANIFNNMLDQMNLLLGKVVEETKRQKDAEIKALQAQISPHFLYNMLNEIKALAKLGRADEISEFVIHLGRLLRRSITYKEAYIRVEEEVEFVKDYLILQQIRYERAFDVNIDIQEEILSCSIPNLILQPIVENSILHGFTDLKKNHVIKIIGKKLDDDKIYFEIYDDGIGVDEDYMRYINNVEKGSGIYGGLGVENVQKRLLLTYGMEYGLQIESQKNHYTKVKITLPYTKE